MPQQRFDIQGRPTVTSAWTKKTDRNVGNEIQSLKTTSQVKRWFGRQDTVIKKIKNKPTPKDRSAGGSREILWMSERGRQVSRNRSECGGNHNQGCSGCGQGHNYSGGTGAAGNIQLDDNRKETTQSDCVSTDSDRGRDTNSPNDCKLWKRKYKDP